MTRADAISLLCLATAPIWIPLLLLVGAVAWAFIGGYSRLPWTKPGSGTRRQHRAAYAEKGFRI